VALPGKGDARRVVRAALLGNLGIAIAKFIAAFLSGSVTMLAEGVHSIADTSNQALLLVGMGLSKRRDPDRYPLGRAKESYFWPFVVALMLFFLGGVYAIYEGYHKLTHPEGEVGSPIAPLAVLVVSIAMEGYTFLVALKEFNKQRGSRPFFEALFAGKDPTIPVVLLEDAGAVVGLAIAFFAVLVTWLTGSTVADAIGSMVIGVLLCCIGVALARDTRSLLIGEGISPQVRVETLEIIRGTERVEGVTQLLSLHLGPDTVLLAMKVRFAPGMALEELERVTDSIEQRVRERFPQMKKIFVEADGDYDASRDPQLTPE
jgi:cation diffusion facilitator family transporter